MDRTGIFFSLQLSVAGTKMALLDIIVGCGSLGVDAVPVFIYKNQRYTTARKASRYRVETSAG